MIEVGFRTGPASLADELRRVVEATLRSESAELNLSFMIVDDDEIHDLNRRFLQHDYPTDVISFDLRDEHGGCDAEIVISWSTAEREAHSRGVEPETELLFYAIHGTLHLLGYDDHEPVQRARMMARQVELLSGLGYEVAA